MLPVARARMQSARPRKRRQTLFLRFREERPLFLLVGEREAIVAKSDGNGPALFQLAEQNFVGEGIAHFLLNHTAERPRAERRLVALYRQPCPCFGRERD